LRSLLLVTFPYYFFRIIAILKGENKKADYFEEEHKMNFLEKCMCKKHKEEILGGILFGAGLVLGSVVTALCYEQKRTVNGDKILENVKKMFLAEAPIEGSWIELHPVPLSRYSSKTDVYYGGISRKEEDVLVQYEFIADAYTGTILDLYKL
jgi:predicted small secreted protein